MPAKAQRFRMLRDAAGCLALRDLEAIPSWKGESLGGEHLVGPAHLDLDLAARPEPEVEHPIVLRAEVAMAAGDLLRLRGPVARDADPRADRGTIGALGASEDELDEIARIAQDVLEEANLRGGPAIGGAAAPAERVADDGVEIAIAIEVRDRDAVTAHVIDAVRGRHAAEAERVLLLEEQTAIGGVVAP